ncbi:MAG: HAD family hydrolase [Nanoarchaeota archaeon]
MIKAVFFDYGGVLGGQAITPSYEEFIRRGKKIQPYRYKELLIDKRVLIGPEGTLEKVLHLDFPDLGVTAEEIIALSRELPRYEDMWKLAKELKDNGIRLGIISDQIAESTKIIREQNHLDEIFEPELTFFSPETGLTKRSRAIFLKSREVAGCYEGEAALVDDYVGNTDLATSAGLIGILHVNYQSTRNNFVNYGLLKNA